MKKLVAIFSVLTIICILQMTAGHQIVESFKHTQEAHIAQIDKAIEQAQ